MLISITFNPMSKFEVFEDASGEFRWRLKAANGEIVATSEGYTDRSSAHQSAQKLASWASTPAEIVDL